MRNDHGMALTVKRAPDGAIWGELDTESALEQPHPESCPSLGIDAEPLEAMGAGEDGCQVDGARVRFLLGRVTDAAVRSRALVGLANGSRVVLVYHVEGLGYREAWFTLRNSKQALSAAIGAPVLEPGAD
ncbi:MAG: hypothetical protein H6983_21455 [Ectothiorhodospiraceae bacterium]|nr:hypothetical protein [Ectothiorhodospiraceae bacterium]